MCRYLLFTYKAYHRLESGGVGGGWLDFYNDFDSEEDAINIGKEVTAKKPGQQEKLYDLDYWHVIDLEQKKRVAGND